MKKKFAVKFLAILFVTTMVCAGSAFAFNPVERDDSSRVTVGQNGYGDVLLGQIYQSLSGYNTTIKVINTSANRAVVAKLVFRSALYSCDVFDIVLYLTPTDMFECEVRLNAAGNVEIYSTDDSVLSDENFAWNGTASCNPFDGIWANESPLQREFYTDCLRGGDINTFGHFEVYGLAAYPATAPLSKDTLAMAYGNIPGVPAVGLQGLIDCDFNLDGAAVDCPNVLTGTLTFDNATYSNKASLNLVALQNWEDSVISSVTVDDTRLSDSTYNSVPEVEAVLAKTEYAIPFDFSAEGDDETVIINTLPTRYEADNGNSAYPALSGGLCNVVYSVYDMQETIILDPFSGNWFLYCLPEVSMQPIRQIIQQAIDINPAYEKGWLRAALSTVFATGTAADTDYTVTYQGVPIINSYLVIDENGAASDDFSLNYAASPESTVYYTDSTGADTYVRQ